MKKVEEVHASDRTVKTCADLSDGKGRGIGGEQAVLLTDGGKLFEGILLDLHVLDRRFDDEVAVFTDVLRTGADAAEDLIGSFLGHFALVDSLLQVGGNSCLAPSGKDLVQVAETDFISIDLRKCLRDAGAHGSSANNAYYHNHLLLFNIRNIFQF